MNWCIICLKTHRIHSWHSLYVDNLHEKDITVKSLFWQIFGEITWKILGSVRQIPCQLTSSTCWRIHLKTHSLQQAPAVAQGGRMKSHVNGATWGVRPSTRQNSRAACSPLLVIFFPRKLPGTETQIKTLSDILKLRKRYHSKDENSHVEYWIY